MLTVSVVQPLSAIWKRFEPGFVEALVGDPSAPSARCTDAWNLALAKHIRVAYRSIAEIPQSARTEPRWAT